jgi:hypothetical protein
MRCLRPLLFGLLVMLAPSVAGAGLEQEVKAAYLFKFLSYVEWSPSALDDAEAPFVIGVLDAEDVRAALQVIVSDQVARGHRGVVRAIRRDESLSGVHVLFVGRSATAELPKLAGRPGILLVSESEGALDKGAMINLVRVEDRVRFEIAPQAAERSGLHISSRLLSLAQFVKAGGR